MKYKGEKKEKEVQNVGFRRKQKNKKKGKTKNNESIEITYKLYLDN